MKDLVTTAILYCDELNEYDFGSGHPFRGGRYAAFMRFLASRLPEGEDYRIVHAEPATEDDLLKICDKDYIDFSRDYYRAANAGWTAYYEGFRRYQSEDNKPSGTPGRLEEAARRVVGQAKLACDLVQGGEYKKAISIGGGLHHATRRFGEGFCIYNDVAFAALYLIEKYDLKRVMVLDTDAHAGNGTAEYVRANPRVLFVDMHQDPNTIYPDTGFASQIGEGEGTGHTVNIPMPVYAGDACYRLVLDEIVLPVAREFRPEIIIRNGGSDPHFEDDLTDLGMTVGGFRMLGDKVREMAGLCQGKHIDLIASGYNERVLPYAWLSLLSGVAGFPLDIEEPGNVPQNLEDDRVLDATRRVVAEVKKTHRDHWKCFR